MSLPTETNTPPSIPKPAWPHANAANTTPSLSEVHASIPIPRNKPAWRQFLAFAGPGALVAVGYVDPGNWATNLAGGSQFAFTLLSVILISNMMAIILQALSIRLGVATGKDLAQACRDAYPKPISITLWILAEIAIAATDLAELIGAAIALNLLFGIPILWGIIITAFDVILLLFLQQKGFRWIESLIIILMATIFGCFAVELFLAKPDWHAVALGYIPSAEIINNPQMLYIAIGILGATVMPHNLYLHSSIVQTRAYTRDSEGKKQAIFFSTIDSTIALLLALLVNSAMLILAASVFHSSGHINMAEIGDAYKLLAPLLGTTLASLLFGIALLASGQNATITGTLSGQIVMEGFTNLRMKPWVRRLTTRLLAIVPAVIVTYLYGQSGTAKLLIFSQVVLSLQLSFAVFPLIMLTSSKNKMGEFVNPTWLTSLSWCIGITIAGFNGYLLMSFFKV